MGDAAVEALQLLSDFHYWPNKNVSAKYGVTLSRVYS
jgi:hypothetical protein